MLYFDKTIFFVLSIASAIVAPFVWGSATTHSYTDGFRDGYHLCMNETQPTSIYTTILNRNVYLFHTFDYQHNETNTNHINYNITNTFIIKYDYKDILDMLPYEPGSVEYVSTRQWLINHLDNTINSLENHFDLALSKMHSYASSQVEDSVNRVSMLIGKNIDELKNSFNVVDQLKKILPDPSLIEESFDTTIAISFYSNLVTCMLMLLTSLIIYLRVSTIVV